MRKMAWAAAGALVLGACVGAGTAETGATTPGDSVVGTALTTSTAPDRAGQIAATCDQLKVGLFDMQEGIDAVLSDSRLLEGLESMSDAEGLELLFGPIVAFYESLAVVADSAPEEVADHLRSLSEWVGPIRSAIETEDPSAAQVLGQEELGEEASTAVSALDAWSGDNCDIATSIDPQSLTSTVLTAALFSALGEGVADLEEGFEGFDEGFSSGTANEVYGDDSDLDALWDRCGTGDDDACDDLFWQSFGVYELFAETCGGRAPFRPSAGGNCGTRMAVDGPNARGDDDYLDALWASCADDDPFSCDSLAGSAPVGSEYEAFGGACGGAFDDLGPRSCTSVDDPFGYGDDAEFDALWDQCASGDAEACSELYFASPISSAYEAMGDTCGALLEHGEDCTLAADLLAVPAG